MIAAVNQYRRDRPHISAIFEIGGIEVFGSLSWKGANPELRVKYFASASELSAVAMPKIENLPLLLACAPPQQVTIEGFTHELVD